jgi:hypothetical protein
VISGNGRQGVGLWHWPTNENTIYNNLIGLSPDGTRRVVNWNHGIDINFGAAFNVVGGTEPGQRNVVSGNDKRGIEISHNNTAQNQVIGNFVGTTVNGNGAAAYTANRSSGIQLKDRVHNNLVAYNVTANNGENGIILDNYGTCCLVGNRIEHNRVGIGINGQPLGNVFYGVRIWAPGSMIGPGNIIAHNRVGIQVQGQANDGNTITQNSIFGNTGLGIDIEPLGQVNQNDAEDGDSGANQQLNFPEIESATATSVAGRACANCTVEVFIADGAADAYGQGKTLIGTGVAAGDGAFTVAVSGVAEGDSVTATATDADGNTSEFARNLGVGNSEPWNQVFDIPGRIEAENYLPGGQLVGYYDTTAGNNGGVYRNDRVDIAVTQDSSGEYQVGWIAPWEWLAYNINVTDAGDYRVNVRVAAPANGSAFHIKIDGNNITGPVAIPRTGGWQVWSDVSVVIPLTAGTHSLRFVAQTSGFNLNYLDIVAE